MSFPGRWLWLATIAVAACSLVLPSSLAEDRQRDRDPPRAERDRGPGTDRDRDTEEETEEGMPSARVAPDQRPIAPQWRLGVFAVNTPTGVRITRVLPDSPAWRAGLERGDVVVTVGGYQVGSVDGRLYPLGEELQRRAGPRGNVVLLVHNVRNRELLNLSATLERYRRGERD